MKALEDLSVRYDNTVRNSEDIVIQLRYGDDGISPHMTDTEGPVYFKRLLANIVCSEDISMDCSEKDLRPDKEKCDANVDGKEPKLTSSELRELVEQNLLAYDGIVPYASKYHSAEPVENYSFYFN
jgi:DNA-directed RNA polymerase III subunit RPC1